MPMTSLPCDPVIVLDARGSVVEINPAAARWAGVSAWRARGRELARELSWIFGADASQRIREFLADGSACARVHATGLRRGHQVEAELVLRRDRERDQVRLAICA